MAKKKKKKSKGKAGKAKATGYVMGPAASRAMDRKSATATKKAKKAKSGGGK